MFKDNALLAQLKQDIQESLPKIEGTIKATDKNFGFLETEKGKSYFVAPPHMRKLVHGDRIRALLREENNKQQAEPESLLEPSLTRFIGRVQQKNNQLWVAPDHPVMKNVIKAKGLTGTQLSEGDWVVAELTRHALRDNNFQAQIHELIVRNEDPNTPWWVTLAKHRLDNADNGIALDRQSPADRDDWAIDDGALVREDLTDIEFFTIDGAKTRDMDDALAIQAVENGWQLTIAIADPAAYIQPNSDADVTARERGFTHYLPGRNISMLPDTLSHDLCSLVAGEKRPAMIARMHIASDGTLAPDAEFSAAWIRSHHQLNYGQVSDFIDGEGEWQPNDSLATQLKRLHDLAIARSQWRAEFAQIFPDRPDYRFELDEDNNVTAIVAEYRRIANLMVEEAMVAANICAGHFLKEKLGFGIFNTHPGIEPEKAEQAVATLALHEHKYSAETLLTLEGFSQMHRDLTRQGQYYLDARMRRYHSYGEISTNPDSHYVMGLPYYATWTSPIRKYGDLINHRLIKAVLCNQEGVDKPGEELTAQMSEQRRLQRRVERDVASWLYVDYHKPAVEAGQVFAGEIINVNRGGLQVRLTDSGATAFVPASALHKVRKECKFDSDNGLVTIQDEVRYRLCDPIKVQLTSADSDKRNLVAKPAAN